MTPPPVADLCQSIMRKCHESARTQEQFFHTYGENLVRCCQAMADAFGRGGRLFIMGNGGSACDAQHLAVEFMHPIMEKRPALPALALSSDTALLSAVGNDQDFAQVFAMQLEQWARPPDMVLGISTSGQSANVNRGLHTARQQGLMTIGFAGRDGGRMRDVCEHLFVVESFSIHRIQEAHTTLLHILWDILHVLRGAEDTV